MNEPQNTAAPYLSDDQLRAAIAQRAQRATAEHLGAIHLQHAEAGETNAVFHAEILSLRGKLLNALERELQLQATIAELRQKLGLDTAPAEADDGESVDPLDGRRTDAAAPRRTDHHYAAAHVPQHHRDAPPEDHPLADAPEHEDGAHALGAHHQVLVAAFDAARMAKGGEDLTEEEIAGVHAEVAKATGVQLS